MAQFGRLSEAPARAPHGAVGIMITSRRFYQCLSVFICGSISLLGTLLRPDWFRNGHGPRRIEGRASAVAILWASPVEQPLGVKFSDYRPLGPRFQRNIGTGEQELYPLQSPARRPNGFQALDRRSRILPTFAFGNLSAREIASRFKPG